MPAILDFQVAVIPSGTEVTVPLIFFVSEAVTVDAVLTLTGLGLAVNASTVQGRVVTRLAVPDKALSQPVLPGPALQPHQLLVAVTMPVVPVI